MVRILRHVFVRQQSEGHGYGLEEHIRWANAFIIVYNVTDRWSFEECSRLLFLVSYAKRCHRHSTNGSSKQVPVVLLGNMNDLDADRVVSVAEGTARSLEIAGCTAFADISVRESPGSVRRVFTELYRSCTRRSSGLVSRSASCEQQTSDLSMMYMSCRRRSSGSSTKSCDHSQAIDIPMLNRRGSSACALTSLALSSSPESHCTDRRSSNEKISTTKRLMQKVIPSLKKSNHCAHFIRSSTVS